MRMDPAQELTAAEIVNTWEPRRLGRAAARLRRGALRRPDRARDRPAPARRRPDHHVRARRRDHRRDPRAGALRRRPPRQAHVPGDPDRGQRRAEPARRGAPARVGPPARRRPPRRDLLPLARGPPRQALPRRPHARLHLPARPARVRLRPDAAGRARVPPLGRADARRDRRQPALEVGPPAGRPQAHRRGGARMTPAARSRAQPHARAHDVAPRAARGASPARSRAGRSPPRRRRHAAGPRHARPSSAASARCPSTARRPPAAQPPVDLAARARCSAGSWPCRSRCSSSTPGISRAVETTTTLERQNADLEAAIARLSAPDRIESGASSLGMLMPPAGDVTLPQRRGRRIRAQAVRRMQPPSEDAAALLANDGIVPGSLVAAAPAPVDAGRGHDAAAADAVPRDARPRSHSRARRHGGAGRHAGARHGRRPRRPRRPPASGGAVAGQGSACVDRAAHRPALRRLPRHARARPAPAPAGSASCGRTRSRPPRPPSRRPTSSSPPAAARSATRTASSWRSPSPRRRSRPRRT